MIRSNKQMRTARWDDCQSVRGYEDGVIGKVEIFDGGTVLLAGAGRESSGRQGRRRGRQTTPPNSQMQSGGSKMLQGLADKPSAIQISWAWGSHALGRLTTLIFAHAWVRYWSAALWETSSYGACKTQNSKTLTGALIFSAVTPAHHSQEFAARSRVLLAMPPAI